MKKFFVVAALFISSFSFAQQDTSKTLNEVIVTANKFPQKQMTTGKVISVITKEQIEKSTDRTLGQLLNEQAGITINGALNNLGSNQTLYIRGASSGRALVLLDGVPVYDPSLINNEFDLNLISLNDVERVEICRGAQSTLYGSDAIAGVVNIITIKKDITKPVNVKATISGGNYSTFRGNVQVYGKAGKLTYSARYGKLYSKGFSAAYDSTGKGNFDRDGYNSDAASAMLQYQATDDLSFKTFVQYSHYKNDLDAGAFTDEKDYSVKNKSLMAGAGFHYTKNNINLTGNYQYSDIKRNYLKDSLAASDNLKYLANDYYGKNQFVEIYSNIGLGKGFTLLQGADYRYSSMNNQYFSISSYGPYATQFKDTSQSQASLYASLIYNALNEKLNIELGGRLNVHSRYGSNSTYTFNPSYNISEHFKIFGSIATGYKAPTLYELYSSYGNLNLQPETSTTYEGGIQQLHPKIQNRIVFFHRNIKSGIDFNNIDYQYYNFLSQKADGIELESKWQPASHLTITANYTYLHPQEQSQSRLTFKDTTYDYLLRRPNHNLNIAVGYGLSNNFSVSVSGKYVSSRYDAGGYQVPDVLLGSYFLLNAYAEYQIKPYIKLFADAQNITNKKFFDVWGYNSIPFLINGGITFNW